MRLSAGCNLVATRRIGLDSFGYFAGAWGHPLREVVFVDEQPATPQSFQAFRKQIHFNKYHYDIKCSIKLSLRSLKVGEIIYCKVNVERELSDLCLASLTQVLEMSMMVTCQPCIASQIACLPAPPPMLSELAPCPDFNLFRQTSL